MSLYDVDGNIIPGSDYEYYSTKDKKTFPQYYGLDVDSGKIISTDDKGRNRVPPGDLSRFPKENLSVIFPKIASAYYGSTIDVYGETTKTYNASMSEVFVNDNPYVVYRWEFADLPNNPYAWKWTMGLGKGHTNATTWILQDVPLEEITAEFIASECMESVSGSFIKAVSLASKIHPSAADISTLKSKVWLALGDSATAFIGAPYTDGVTPSTTGKWGALASELGMILYGYGIPSSTIRYSDGSTGHAYQPMVTRVDTLIKDHIEEADNVGLITFMGGGNDSESYLGDLKSVDKTTLYGACHQIFNKLVNAFPNAKIVVILQHLFAYSAPPENSEFSEMTTAQYNIYLQQTKQRIVKEVAEFYGLTICDCCFNWYNPTNPKHFSEIWGEDNLHLSDLGNKKLTEKLVATLDAIFV